MPDYFLAAFPAVTFSTATFFFPRALAFVLPRPAHRF